jgi:hypothetical protein
MRATRALLRRARLHRTHTRAALLAHGHQTKRPYTLPAMGTTIASQANRDGVAERCAAPAVPKRLAVDLARIPSADARLGTVALRLRQTARHHDAHPLSLWHTVPGIGQMLSLGRLSAIHDRHRFPRGQACLSSGRLVLWSQAAAGTRLGTSGAQSGQAPLQGACAAAAGLFLSDPPAAPQYLARLEQKPDQGPACTIRAQQLARAVSSRRTRQVAVDTATCGQRSGWGAEAPAASLDNPGHAPQRGTHYGGLPGVRARHSASRSPYPEPCAWLGPPLALLVCAALVAHGQRGRRLTRAWRSLDHACAWSPLGDEDGMRARSNGEVAEETRAAALPASRP